MEDRSAETTKTLIGHTRSVTKISFSPDKTLLVSSSVDGTGECVTVTFLFSYYCQRIVMRK